MWNSLLNDFKLPNTFPSFKMKFKTMFTYLVCYFLYVLILINLIVIFSFVYL